MSRFDFEEFGGSFDINPEGLVQFGGLQALDQRLIEFAGETSFLAVEDAQDRGADDGAQGKHDSLFSFVEAAFPAAQIAEIDLQRCDQVLLAVEEWNDVLADDPGVPDRFLVTMRVGPRISYEFRLSVARDDG